MKAVFLGRRDWANTSNAIARAINRAGGMLTARAVTLLPHPFGYPEDVVIERDGETNAREALDGADWVIQSGDGAYSVFDRLMRQLGVDRRKVRLATRHSGSRYRNDPALCDRLDREWGFERRFMACDLYRFVLDDPRARVFLNPPLNRATAIRPVPGAVRICHTPSNREIKGTDVILEAIQSLRNHGLPFDFEMIEKVGYSECARRRSTCHILVDQFFPPVGGFGAAATEALSDGLAVVSHCGHVVPDVEKWLPLPPIVRVETPADLRRAIRALIEEPERLRDARVRSLAWARRVLSPEFTHDYWLRHLSFEGAP